MLEVDAIHTYYGDSHVLQGVSLRVHEKEIVALIGRNGAGKTTTLRSIMGLVVPRRGSVRFEGFDITRLPPERTARLGIGYVPEHRGIIPNLTVAENLHLATLHDSRRKKELEERLEAILQAFPRLRERYHQDASSLSGGEQQMLAIARALVVGPKLLLVDEPTQGLAPLLVEQILDRLVQINREQRTSILLVEQNAILALAAARRAYVIDQGVIVLEGDADEVSTDPGVQRAYLGA